MAASVTVKAPASPAEDYPIIFQRGLLTGIGAEVARFGLNGRVAVLTNETVAPLYGETLCGALPDARLITMPDGEAHKHMGTVAALLSQMAAAGLDRASTVVALGGGVVGDTAGFAAACYMRGVRLIQIPTTLLAMVDSSVGGKVGVDLPEGKNLAGAFKQPAAVLIDPNVLTTLPVREWRCGMAETLKHGMIADPGLIEIALQANVDILELVRRAVQVKINLVQEDPFEHGVRAHLNLGHTFGHAIEIVSDFAWLHGEAVAIGIAAAARLSARIGMCSEALVEQIEVVLTHVGLPIKMGNLETEQIWATMGMDKKWQGGQSRFILLRDLGHVEIVKGVAKADVMAVLESLNS
jgi:3-dehydroquinate synthase